MNPHPFEQEAVRARALGLRVFRAYDGDFVVVTGQVRQVRGLRALRELIDRAAAGRELPPEPWRQNPLDLHIDGAPCAQQRTTSW